jgi:glutamate-1-semialdehyde 2,1-aminomutase
MGYPGEFREGGREMEPYRTPKSDEIGEAALEAIPGSLMSNFRRYEDTHPVYMTHGKGARLYDVDGNEYIDYSLSYGPSILGHSNERLQQAIIDQAKRLYTGEATELQLEAARKVCSHLVSAERVRFACSGSEATYNALRAARAYTKRSRIVRFNGHYHGGLDEFMGGIVTEREDPTPIAGELEEDIFSQMTNTAGRAPHAFSDSYMLEWNDLVALEQLFSAHASDIAAVIMEPVMVNCSGCVPEPGYLEGVRELCTRNGTVLIFDEVLTGFRMGLGGAQGYFGIVPDMTTLGKAVGGGFPVAAFCGKSGIMETIASTEVVSGGTYNGHPLAMAAVIANIEELEKDDGAAYRRIEEHGLMLKDGLDTLTRRYQQNLLFQGFPGAWTFAGSSKSKLINHRESLGGGSIVAGIFAALLKQRGVLTSFRFCTSAAHTERDVRDTLERVEDALREMARSPAGA